MMRGVCSLSGPSTVSYVEDQIPGAYTGIALIVFFPPNTSNFVDHHGSLGFMAQHVFGSQWLWLLSLFLFLSFLLLMVVMFYLVSLVVVGLSPTP